MTRTYSQSRCLICGQQVTLVHQTICDEQQGRGIVTYGEICDECEMVMASEILDPEIDETLTRCNDNMVRDRE